MLAASRYARYAVRGRRNGMTEQRRESQQWCGRDNRHLENFHKRNRHLRYDDHEHRSLLRLRFYRCAVSNLSAADKDFVMTGG